MVQLPFPTKLLIAAALAANFTVITQWEYLSGIISSKAPLPAPAPKTNESKFKFETSPVKQSFDDSAAQEFLIRRLAPISITDPKIERDGRIIHEGQSLTLYGLKSFDARNVCTHSSGERWACGLQAYALLRNELAHKTIVCRPKKLMENGLSVACHFGSQDVALMLARHGLAEVDNSSAEAELLAAQAEARKKKIGIWDRQEP